MLAGLTDALTIYSLNPEDLPGIEEAWTARFADLEQGIPEDEKSALLRLRPAFAAWNDVVIEQVVPRSDGALLVSVEGARYEGSYATDLVTFHQDEAHQFLLAHENGAEIRRLRGLLLDLEQMESGAYPIWWVGAAPGIASRYQATACSVYSALSAVERCKEHLGHIDTLQEALDTFTPIPDSDELYFPYASGFARGVKPSDVVGAAWNDKRVVLVHEVNRTAKDLATRTPELATLQAAIDEAQALPAGALREYLVGEREPHTYNDTEGTGRRKRTVKKSYTPVSDLVREHRTALTAHTSAAGERDDLVQRLDALRTTAARALATAGEQLLAAEQVAAQTWAEGWTGEGAPPAPLPSGITF